MTRKVLKISPSKPWMAMLRFEMGSFCLPWVTDIWAAGTVASKWDDFSSPPPPKKMGWLLTKDVRLLLKYNNTVNGIIAFLACSKHPLEFLSGEGCQVDYMDLFSECSRCILVCVDPVSGLSHHQNQAIKGLEKLSNMYGYPCWIDRVQGFIFQR